MNFYNSISPFYPREASRLLLVILCFGAWSVQAQMNLSFETEMPSCHGGADGKITVEVSGGMAPYTYLWSNNQSGPTNYGVPAGTWSVTVTDANGNTTSGSVTLGEPPLLVAHIEPTGDVCLGTDGDLVANVSGGTPPYHYLWSTGDTTPVVTNLVIGFYGLTVTDANDCKVTDGIGVNIPLSVTVKTIDGACYGWCDGSAEAIVVGGTPPYTYAWNTGATDPLLNPLPPGTYIVTVTDANGCTATGTGIINEPPDIEISIDIDDPCNGNASVDVTATGGVPPLSYQWAHGPTTPNLTGLSEGYYYLTVTSANGICKKDTFIVISDGVEVNPIPTSPPCATTGSVVVEVPNGIGPLTWILSNGTTYDDKFISGLSPGNYSVTVVDAAGCTGSADFEILPTIDIFTIDVNATPAACDGTCDGTATVFIVTPGALPYTYQWDSNAGNQTTATAAGLCAGTYTVTVNDGNGCPQVDTVIVEQIPSQIELEVSSTPASCDGTCDGTATVTVISGVAPYTYQWDSNAGNQTTATATGLCAGTYTVTVNDANGCPQPVSVTVGQVPSQIALETSSTPASCDGTCDGTATVTVI
ncbi:MAG: hypothetical protein D6714_12960, partial [Bacteroidetes bacterium]